MIVQIILITLGFVIALSYPTGIEPLGFLPVNPPKAAASILSILLLSAGYIALGAWLARAQVKNNLNHYYRRIFNYRILLLPVYSAQVYIFHLPSLIAGGPGFIGLDIGQIPFVTKFLILAPFLLTLVLSYIPFYRVERFIYSQSIPNEEPAGAPSLLNFLIFQIRTYLMLAVLPLLFFILAFDLLYALPGFQKTAVIYPFIEWGVSILLLLSLYLLAPFGLKYLWGTRPLEPGPLRDYLQSIAGRAGIKIRDFLVWPVGRRPFANALLIGIFPFNRFVIFTDTLIRNLAAEETGAVFAHEVGHAKFRHLLILLIFTVSYLGIVFSLSVALAGLFGNGLWDIGFSLAMIMFFWLVLFGRLSRRFELQADWFAARITGNPDSFTRALTKIAVLNGIPMRSSGLSNLTHPSIDLRISSVNAQAAGPSGPIPAMKKIIALLAISALLALLGLGYTVANEIKSAPRSKLKLEAFEYARQARLLLSQIPDKRYSELTAEEHQKTQAGISLIEKAISSDPKQPYYRLLMGAVLEQLGTKYLRLSQTYYQKAYELEPTDPAERYYLKQKLANQ